jgi:hypothetical protein
MKRHLDPKIFGRFSKSMFYQKNRSSEYEDEDLFYGLQIREDMVLVIYFH